MSEWCILCAAFALVLITAGLGFAAEFEARKETEHFEIYYHSGQEQQADNLLSFHENSYAFVTGFIGYQPPSKIKIYLCSTPEEFAEVGNTPPEAKPPVGGSAGQWSNGVLSYYNPSGGQVGVAHELVHAVESQFLPFERPRWWVEGLACYLTYKFMGEIGPGGLYSNQLSDFMGSILENSVPFKTLGELEGEVVLTKFGYEESTSVFLFIDEKYGESKLREIIQAASAWENVHAAFQAVLGIGFHAFEAEWRTALTLSVVAIAEARGAVGMAERDGRTQGLDEARAKLSEAEEAFNSGKFGEAKARADEAKALAESASREAAGSSPLPIVVIVIVAAIALAAACRIKLSRSAGVG